MTYSSVKEIRVTSHFAKLREMYVVSEAVAHEARWTCLHDHVHESGLPFLLPGKTCIAVFSVETTRAKRATYRSQRRYPSPEPSDTTCAAFCETYVDIDLRELARPVLQRGLGNDDEMRAVDLPVVLEV